MGEKEINNKDQDILDNILYHLTVAKALYEELSEDVKSKTLFPFGKRSRTPKRTLLFYLDYAKTATKRCIRTLKKGE